MTKNLSAKEIVKRQLVGEKILIILSILGAGTLVGDIIRGSVYLMSLKASKTCSIIFFILLLMSTHWFEPDEYDSMTKKDKIFSVFFSISYQFTRSVIFFCIIYGLVSIFERLHILY